MNSLEIDYNNMTIEMSDIQEKIKSYPKGNLRKRIIKGREYYYLQYREGKHVRSRYIKAEDTGRLQLEIEERKELEEKARDLENRLTAYAKLLGKHRNYRPVKDIDYEDYTLFMSTVAHDYKTLNMNEFLMKYELSKYRGLNKRYLAGFLDYINGIDRNNPRKTNDIVLDPYTYLMYFKYDQKDVLEEELKHAIPAFLDRGILITNVQEAVNGPCSTKKAKKESCNTQGTWPRLQHIVNK